MSWRFRFFSAWQYLRTRVLAPLARQRIQVLLRAGLPLFLRQPLTFLIEEKLDPKEIKVARQIESLRAQLAQRRGESFKLHNDARLNLAPFAEKMAPAGLEARSGEYLAMVSSIPRYWGVFLHLCANATRARVILELGSCAGISGAYLASSPYCEQFITIDGSADAAALAESNIRNVTQDYQIIHAAFDDGLNAVFQTLSNKIDLVYIDGDHEKEPTLHYFRRILPYLNASALVIFDDITWSPDMWEAWQSLCAWRGISHAINVGRLGLCIWSGGHDLPMNYDLSNFTRSWRDGRRSMTKAGMTQDQSITFTVDGNH